MESLKPGQNVITPKVCGEARFTLSMGFSDFDVTLSEPLDSWFIRARFWGFDDYVCISVVQPNQHLPIQFFVSCALDDFFRYWQDSQFVYLELVDPALLEPVAFSYIDCQAFSEYTEDTWIYKESIVFYHLETGCVHSSACFSAQLERMDLS